MASYEQTVVSVSAAREKELQQDCSSPALLRKRRHSHWSDAEDAQLLSAVQSCGAGRWTQVAKLLPGRNAVQCLHRWNKIRSPGQGKNCTWRPEEDAALLTWVKAHGPYYWTGCSRFVKGRNGKQCRERWKTVLDPAHRSENWTLAEDSLIADLYYREGLKWDRIAPHFPGRSENAIKNRFYSRIRRQLSPTPKIPPHSPQERDHNVLSVDESIRQQTISAIHCFFMQFSPEELAATMVEERGKNSQAVCGLATKGIKGNRIQ